MFISAIRLVPVPPLEPPFDDQRGPDEWPLMPPEAGAQLTLQWPQRDQPRMAPAGAGARATAGMMPSAANGPSQAAWHATLLFLGRCQEILNGYRPAAHLRPLSAPAQAQSIVDHVTTVARRTAMWQRAAPAAGRTGPGGRPGMVGRVVPGGRSGVVSRRRVHVCEPRVGVAEATAVLSQGSRSWAVAFRLERRGAVWLCTAFTDVTQRPAEISQQTDEVARRPAEVAGRR